MYKPVAVIGYGAISAAGRNVKEGYQNILSGETFLTPLSLFNTKNDRAPLSGEIKDLDTTGYYSRTETLATIAINNALEGIDLKGSKIGLIVATTVGGVDNSENEYLEVLNGNKTVTQSDFSGHEAGALTGSLAQKFKVDGFLTVSTACSTGLQAIGLGKKLINNNEFDLVITVGTDGLCKLTVNGFDSLLLIDPTGAHPFDKDRLGIALGEGAGAVILASDSAIKKSKATVKAYISGWGASADAYHMTSPHPHGDGAKSAMRNALKDSSLQSVDWLISHGTSTIDNDFSETKAMRDIFNNKIPPFTSFKGSIGHTLAASGSLEVAYGLEAMSCNAICKTVNFTKEDDLIQLSPSNYKKQNINSFMKVAFGFGGNNSAIVVTKERS